MPVPHDAIDTICRIAARTDKRSPLDRLRAAQYSHWRPALSVRALKSHLHRHPELIDDWLAFSEDKRTDGGWYFQELNGGWHFRGNWEVGRLDKGCRVDGSRFRSRFAACAAYILRELDSY